MVSDVEIMIGARNNRVISENVFLKQQDTLTWFWLLHHFACRSICVQEGQSRGTCKKASESSKDLRVEEIQSSGSKLEPTKPLETNFDGKNT